MREQVRLAARNARQPLLRSSPMSLQGLELPTSPSRQDMVDVPKVRVKSRLVVPAIIMDPAADVRVEHSCQIIKRLVAALMKRPAAYGLPDRLESFVARCWAERDTEPIPSARQPRPERVAEKVELLVTIGSAPVILAPQVCWHMAGTRN